MFSFNFLYKCLVMLSILKCSLLFQHLKFLNKNSPAVFSDCTYGLSVTQDGPVTLDIPITFSVDLNCGSDDGEYVYHFEDDADPPRSFEIKGNKSVSLSLVYREDIYNAGHYIMTVSAYVMMLDAIYMKVAMKNVSFYITEYISGHLVLNGTNERENDENLYVATGKEINMTINLDYPQRVYEESEISYSWTIDKDQFITSVPYNSYNFSRPGNYHVHLAVVARIPIYDRNGQPTQGIKYKWGSYNEKLIVKDPFFAVNLTGNTYLQHGQLFNLDVVCNGSGPFEYCWKVMLQSGNVTNLTCSSPVVTTQCAFPIIYYFHESGDYRVAIYVDNFVSAMQRNVDVHIYDVSQRPQLMTVIIPLFCTVLVVLIIASGVMLHVRRNQTFDTETADFDFLQSDPCDVETFWEHLYNSILRASGVFRNLPQQFRCIANRQYSHSHSHSSYNEISP